MRFLQRFIAHFFSLIIALSLLLCVSLPVFAASKYKITVDGATISFEAPDNFIGYTKDDMDKNANEFAAFPISKNEAINKIEAGTIINLFSASEKREIELSVVDSDNLSKYNLVHSTIADSNLRLEKKSNDLLKNINNYSALDEKERQMFISLLTDELKDENHTFLSTPANVEISGYHFIKTYARIGNSTSGYTYTSLLTILGGKCYRLTCFNNSPMLEQEQIDNNDEILSSLNITIEGNNGEISTNNWRSVLTYIIIILAAAMIIGIIISFIQPIIANRNAPESVKTRKRR